MLLGNLYNNTSPEKIKSQQVYKEDRFHVIQLQIKKGELLKPHHASTDAFLLVAEGAIEFSIRDEKLYLQKGDMLNFKKNETHAVRAMEDAIVLLIK